MKKLHRLMLAFVIMLTYAQASAEDWSNVPIPADAGTGKVWELQENVSDDFNYTSSFGSGEYASRTNFGSSNQWNNFYHNAWDGPGYTYWDNSNVSVDGDNLVITAGYTSETEKGGSYGVASGCVTSNNTVKYPVYVESAISVANISLASCFWLLSPDDTEEIDIIENYGGVDGYKHLTHISHHSFVRSPFTDYQPRDWNSWYPDLEGRLTTSYGWGDWCWNNGGERRYMRMGVYWISPKHFEYYIDGELVRVMYYNAIATNYNGTWQYTYFNSMNWNVNGYMLPTNNGSGYTDVTTYSTSSSYNFATLQAASNASNGYNVIDPAWFQGGDDSDADGNGVTNEAKGFTKDLEIIINIESQSWLTGSTPSYNDLNDPSKNQMKVDWVRVYKPVPGDPDDEISVTGISVSPTTLALNTGETGNITGSVAPTNADIQTMTFTSNNEAIATVTQSGVVTAVSSGTAIITATSTDGGFTATSTITVSDIDDEISVTGISVSPTTLALNTGETGNITGAVAPTNADIQTMTFTSNNEAIATVTQSGVVTAVSSGTAIITATSTDGGFTATSTITVSDIDNGDNIVIQAESFTETGGTYDDGYVTNGVNSTGTTINYVNSEDWATYSLTNVPSGVYSIAYSISTPLDNAAISIYIDDELISSDNVTNNGGWDDYYSLAAQSSAEITEGNHTVKIVASGSNAWQFNLDKITLTRTGDLPDDEIPVTGISVSPTTLALTAGETGNITGAVAPTNADIQTMTFVSSDEAVATVTQAGVVSAITAGTATITVTSTDGGFTATSTVTVSPIVIDVTGISLTPATLAIEVGQTGNITGAVSPTDATDQTMTFVSSDESVATVTQAGIVSAIAEGTATITATSTDGGFTATSAVTVSAVDIVEGTIVIEAEDFAETGGTYNDGYVTNGVNSTGTTINYVNSEDWVTYSLTNVVSGVYSINYSISTPLDNAAISIYIDDELVSSDNVTNNGGWDDYITLTSDNSAELSAGNHTIKIVASGSNAWQWNMDKITLTRTGDLPDDIVVDVTGIIIDPSTLDLFVGEEGNITGEVIPSDATDQTMTFVSSDATVATVTQSGVVTAVSAGTATITVTSTDGGYAAICTVTVTENNSDIITIEAEDLTETGGTYNDSYVTHGVNVVSGVGLNWVNNGDWATYDVTIPQDGAYQIVYYISSPITGSTIDFSVDDVLFNTTTVPNNGGWDDYEALEASSTANLTAGEHEIKITAGSTTWTWNIDKITIQRVGEQKSAVFGSNNSELGNIVVYPIPASESITIDGLSDENYEVSIYNLIGVVCKSSILDSSSNTISISELPAGNYILIIKGDATNKVVRISKQ